MASTSSVWPIADTAGHRRIQIGSYRIGNWGPADITKPIQRTGNAYTWRGESKDLTDDERDALLERTVYKTNDINDETKQGISVANKQRDSWFTT